MEQIYTPPCNVDWFQAELEKITADKAPPMRIQWAPLLTVAKVISNDGTERKYAKYPLLSGEFISYQRGIRYVRNGITVGYQKTTDSVVPQGVKLTDVAVADWAYVNPSAHIFVIERKLPNDSARKIHEEKREMAIIQLGLDIFGPFPKEGHWDWFMDIAEHRFEMQGGVRVSCCETARNGGASYCRGLYRSPSNRDLREVRRAVAFWLERIQGHEKDANYQDKMAEGLRATVRKRDRAKLIDHLKRAEQEDRLRVAYEHSTRVPELPKETYGPTNIP